MFEVGVISIVVLAVGYWATLWLMGRHDDVLQATPLSAFPPHPPFPKKPEIHKPAPARPAAVKRAERRSASKVQAPLPAGPDSSDSLQTLLASIKRHLKDASQL